MTIQNKEQYTDAFKSELKGTRLALQYGNHVRPKLHLFHLLFKVEMQLDYRTRLLLKA